MAAALGALASRLVYYSDATPGGTYFLTNDLKLHGTNYGELDVVNPGNYHVFIFYRVSVDGPASTFCSYAISIIRADSSYAEISRTTAQSAVCFSPLGFSSVVLSYQSSGIFICNASDILYSAYTIQDGFTGFVGIDSVFGIYKMG